MKIMPFVLAGLLATAASGCHSKQQAAADPSQSHSHAVVIGNAGTAAPTASYMPRAVIYKTNVDAFDLVPVVLTADGRNFVTYPAPSDLNRDQMPLRLADGWLLDRRGAIGPGTAFLRYTYSEYEALPQAPSPEQLRDAILPDVHVTEAYRLPVTLSEARNDTAAVNALISAGLKDATPIVK